MKCPSSKEQELRSCLDENLKHLKLLLFIFDHMDKYNAVICSYKVFQETLGMGQATVARCVKYLKDHGFLCLQNRYKQCLCCQ